MSKSIKILIIDDDASIRESLELYFKTAGYAVSTASEPALCSVYQHANCTAEDRCADALMIDQNMPGMTGVEFIRRQSERGCKLPARYKLIMTGALTEEVRALAESLGCQVVQKPFSLVEARRFVLTAETAQ